MTDTPLPDRPCGSCTVCCVAPGIDELKKFPNSPCVHLAKPVYGNHHQCSIYDKRPAACSRFYCNWTMGLGPTANGRPDRSGLLSVMYPPHDDEPLSAVITIVDARKCGELSDPTSLINQFLRELLACRIADIKIINRTTNGLIWIKDGLIRKGELGKQQSYESLDFIAYDPPVGLVQTTSIEETPQ